eukprot:TRINITY_DN9615_c0_g1_i2.p1 TRINITY_DN9615_c0_g1~~TRINITY_DN9615_c0_g1_i2.p1  ORF type:complete len:132 (+),score=6.74 TRINITY_DN9615_c0_g1_i2:541-936(+)
MMEPILDTSCFEYVVHGTKQSLRDTISWQGLSTMDRLQIHFYPLSKVGGSYMYDKNLLVFLDVKAWLESGGKLFQSSNNVILSPGDEKGFIDPLFLAFGNSRQFTQKNKSSELSVHQLVRELFVAKSGLTQ